MAEEHHHHHAIKQKGVPLFVAIGLNLLITIAQVIGGVVSGSLSLIGDALHNFSDVLSLIISYIANLLSRKKSNETRTFGYKRAQILAAFINAITLVGVSVYLIIEAAERLLLPHQVLSGYVIWLAIAGIVVNGGSVILLAKMQKGDSNLRAAFLHLIGDLATSFAVLLGGIAMKLYQVYWIDSAITILVSIYLILMAGKLFLHTISVLMQFVPSHLDVKEICNKLEQVEEIEALHHIHLWRLNDDSIHFEAHVVLREDISVTQFERVKERLTKILMLEYNIDHSIFQPEIEGCKNQELVNQE